MPRFDLALFDVDGTLVGQHYRGATPKREAFARAIQEVCGRSGVSYAEVLGARLAGMTDRPIVRETLLALGLPRAEAERLVEPVLAAAVRAFDELIASLGPRSYPLVPGARELLDELRAAGLRLGAATGNLEHFARWKLRTAGLDAYFPAGGFADDAEERAGIVRAALARFPGATPARTVLFGDAPSDVRAAQAVGLPVVVHALTAEGGSHPRAALAALRPPPDLILDGWRERAGLRRFLGLA